MIAPESICTNTSEVTLNNMGKPYSTKPQEDTTKHKL